MQTPPQDKQASRAAVFGPMRLPFVILTPACVALGVATALAQGMDLNKTNAMRIVLVLVGAIAAHIGVNALNEYSDFRTGLDQKTKRTPFSGGSGVLPAYPNKAHYALIAGLVSAGIVAAIGVYFLFVRGLQLLPLGVAGLLVVLLYTPWITRHWFLCLIAPGLGFGTLMVMGTHVALTGTYAWTALVASFVPFFLVNNLLLLNQYPDMDPDRENGRKNVLIVFGPSAGSVVYVMFLAGVYVSIVIGYAFSLFPLSALIGLGTLLLAIPTGLGVFKHAQETDKLIPLLGRNVVLNLSTPFLLALGIMLG